MSDGASEFEGKPDSRMKSTLTGVRAEKPEMESLGKYLKRERELRQISIAEVAQTTRIPARILEQLEGNELVALPADVFVRGYLRAYARAVSLDEGDVLSRYQSKPEPEAPPPLPAL